MKANKGGKSHDNKHANRNDLNMKIPLSELEKASKEFRAASQSTDEVMKKLDKVIKDLESVWEDAGKQIFYQYYREWHIHAGSISQLLNLTADELNAIAERYSVADGETATKNK
jgi:WXG100 family type VII secretion target